MSNSARTVVIRLAGLLIFLLAFGSLLLPLAPHISGPEVIGVMLVAAGLIELAAV